MTQEKQKELLLKDLCARLPYGVKCKLIYNNKAIKDEDATLFAVDKYGHFLFAEFGEDIREFVCKPYLFPISSMTEKLIHEFYCMFIENDISFEDFVTDYWNINSFHKLMTSIDNCGGVVEWFNENHCDYRGLIEKGLAIDATNLNIYYQ